MKKLIFQVFVFSFTLFSLVGCSSKNLSYSHIPDLEIDGSINIYLDRHGFIYSHSDITDLYKDNFYTTSGDNSIKNIYEMKKGHNKISWNKVQESRWQRKINQINALLDDNSQLIVLIHGYNVSNSNSLYSSIRGFIKKYTKNKQINKKNIFVNVHWDGLVSKYNFPIGHWGSAQYNAPLVGLQLRKLFKGIDSSVPIRIMTHSSGGIIVASLIGDASDALPAANNNDDKFYDVYRENSKGSEKYSILDFDHLTIGMIVPATPSSSFSNIMIQNNLKLIVGQNEDDIAVSKAFIGGCSSLFGSTCLAVSSNDYKKLLGYNRDNVSFYKIDFSNSQINKKSFFFWDEHSWITYLNRDNMNMFLNLLFEM